MNFQVETSSICNLKCVECPQRLMKRRREVMSLDIFMKILEEYIIPFKDVNRNKGHIPTIILHKDGEPLINPRLREFIMLISAADPKMKIDIYTNGILLTQDFIRFLGSIPNPVSLLVSFHFFNEDGKETNYENTETVLKEALENKPSNVTIIMVSHITRFAPKERLDNWRAMWLKTTKIGEGNIHVNPHINPWTGLINEPNCVKFSGCPYADFGHIFFGASGNIIPCCMMLEEDVIFGNVMRDNPLDIMDRLKLFYEAINKKDIIHSICKKCLGEK